MDILNDQGHTLFLQKVNESLSRHYSGKMDALWKLLTTGDSKWIEPLKQHEQSYQHLLNSPEWIMKVKEYSAQGGYSQQTIRQLTVLSHEMQEYHNNESRDEINQGWNELNYQFNSFCTDIDGSKLTNKETLLLFRILKDERKRKQLWLAYMQLGINIAPTVIELTKKRNKLANNQGFKNYYVMKLASQEMNPDIIERIIINLQQGLGESYRKAKEDIDAELCVRYATGQAGLRSWHYEHPFFQSYDSPQYNEALDLNKMNEAISEWLVERGYQISDISKNVDVAERKGKSSANFCLSIDRREDIRISCQANSDLRGARILFHEWGHALFEHSYDASLPFLLRQPAHSFMSEAAALLLERFVFLPGWQQLLGEQRRSFLKQDDNQLREMKKHMLVKLFWTLTLVRFEQKLYDDPDQNLNELWWNLIEEFQGIPRPAEWDAPYWANIPHLSTLPASYYNYLLGEVAASQFQQYLENRFGEWHNKPAMQHMRETIFSKGISRTWKEVMLLGVREPLHTADLIHHLQL